MPSCGSPNPAERRAFATYRASLLLARLDALEQVAMLIEIEDSWLEDVEKIQGACRMMGWKPDGRPLVDIVTEKAVT
jgi:hypothetical protein